MSEMENKPTDEQTEEKKRRFFKTKEQKQKEKENKSTAQEVWEWIRAILSALILAVLIRSFIFEPVKVDGASMNNTLADEEIMIASKLDYTSIWFNPFWGSAEEKENCAKWTIGGEPKRFDVVICRYPGRGDTNFVKRVVGLPGDRVKIYEGYLYVNDVKYEEPYIDDSYRIKGGSNGWYYPEITVPEGQYFVMGDHRNNSNDSRSIGPISRDKIIGRVAWVVFPFSGFRGIPYGDTYQVQ